MWPFGWLASDLGSEIRCNLVAKLFNIPAPRLMAANFTAAFSSHRPPPWVFPATKHAVSSSSSSFYDALSIKIALDCEKPPRLKAWPCLHMPTRSGFISIRSFCPCYQKIYHEFSKWWNSTSFHSCWRSDFFFNSNSHTHKNNHSFPRISDPLRDNFFTLRMNFTHLQRGRWKTIVSSSAHPNASSNLTSLFGS